jgi:hypothetical protein
VEAPPATHSPKQAEQAVKYATTVFTGKDKQTFNGATSGLSKKSMYEYGLYILIKRWPF